jgi:HEAT repeat protein
MRRLSCASLFAVLLALTTVLGQTKEDVPELQKQLKDADPFVRLKAAKLLGKVGGGARDALPALHETAAKDADIDVRAVARNAAEAIKVGSMKDLPESAVEALKILKKSAKASERTKALEDIAALGPDGRDATADLVEALVASPPSGYQPFLDALEKINPTLQKPILVLLIDKDNGKKNQALDDLQKLGDDAEPAVPALLFAYKNERVTPYQNPGQSLCAKLVATMGKVAPHHKAVGQLVMGVFNSGNANERTARAAAIEVASAMDLDSKNFVSFLTTALNDPSTRLKAVEALGKLGPAAKSALPLLTKLKLDSDAGVRDAAAKAIDEIKPTAK